MYRNATTSATRNVVDKHATRFGVQIARPFFAQYLPQVVMWLSRLLEVLGEPRWGGRMRPLTLSAARIDTAGQPAPGTRLLAGIRCPSHRPGSRWS